MPTFAKVILALFAFAIVSGFSGTVSADVWSFAHPEVKYGREIKVVAPPGTNTFVCYWRTGRPSFDPRGIWECSTINPGGLRDTNTVTIEGTPGKSTPVRVFDARWAWIQDEEGWTPMDRFQEFTD